MVLSRDEAQLVLLAAESIEDAALTPAEVQVLDRAKTLLGHDATFSAALTPSQGEDWLGERFTAIRPVEVRRDDGATYTPASVVEAMVAWAVRSCPDVERVVDTGAGSGRFTLTVARELPRSMVVAVEKDPLAAILLRANVTINCLVDRVHIRVEDYRDTQLPKIGGRTLFLGNPPYVRHHKIGAYWKQWYSEAMKHQGIKASKLAGLHLHFFIKSLELAQPGDLGCFITAAEWLDVNYGEALRKLLVERLATRSLDVIDPQVQVFDDAFTSAVITTFEVGAAVPAVHVRWNRTMEQLNHLGVGETIPTVVFASCKKWGPLIETGRLSDNAQSCVGDFFKVKRGQVTGNNDVWIVGSASVLPPSVLVPAVTKARELLGTDGTLQTTAGLRCIVDIPPDYSHLADNEREAIKGFLAYAKARGADQSYIAQHRTPWYSVKLYPPAPIICTYMARRPPTFVVNACNAHHINIAHGLYPRKLLGREAIERVAQYLREGVAREAGRTYAGGLTKFEPKEIERLPLPREVVLGTVRL